MNLTQGKEKNIIALAVIAIAFGIFVIFFQNQEELAINGTTAPFTLLAAGGMGLMIVLFYLVSSRSSSKKSSSRKKR